MAKSYQLKSTGSRPRPGRIDFASELNEQQLAAVTAPPGPALVIAGAGSGKTRTLTYRVAHLIDQGYSPRDILLLTFTNKAAREMLDRVADLIPADTRGLWGGTFHSIGHRMLQRFAESAGFRPGFSIMDKDDQTAMLRMILSESKADTKAKGFPKAPVLASLISLAANTARTLDEVIEDNAPHLLDHRGTLTMAHAEYVRRKIDSNAMDFDDLLTRAAALLREDDEAGDHFRKRFRAILVDEYQDTNVIQAGFVDQLARDHRHLMVVGDDCQSIYSWRGADTRNILEFQDRYPDAILHRIETNYRSQRPILDLANAAIEENVSRIEKVLTPAREGPAVKPAVVSLATSAEQAALVAQRIEEYLDDGVSPDSIAVLYRAHFHSMELQMELTRRGVPFRITSGLRFFEQAHVKDVASFVKFAVNCRDEIAFQRCVRLLPGIGERSAAKLWRQTAGALGGDPANMKRLLECSPPPKASRDWTQLVHTWCEIVPDGEPLPPVDMLGTVVEAIYKDYAQAAFTNADSRLDDIGTLIGFADQFEDTAEFLSQLALLTNLDAEGDARANTTGDPMVSLSSIHQAKGLEWKVVFVISLADGLFPTYRSLDDPDAIEEERRLFYVAVTRAMDELILTWPEINTAGHGGESFLTQSRFLTSLPHDLIEDWEIERDW